MNLSKQNLDLATQYFLGDTTMLDQKDDDFKNLFLSFASDNNSSTMREAVTLHYLGYDSYSQKHGADGINPKTNKQIEVKPKFLSEGKLGNTGNFNDMTMDLLNKKIDFNVVCSLFFQSRLIYIVEFPLTTIYEKLKEPIINAKAGKRVVCQFNYLNYDTDDLVIHYFNEELAKQYNCLSKPHLQMLTRHNGTTD